MTAPPVPASVSLMRADVACLSAVLVAEIVHHYFPKLVELHNYRHVSGWTALSCSELLCFNRPGHMSEEALKLKAAWCDCTHA